MTHWHALLTDILLIIRVGARTRRVFVLNVHPALHDDRLLLKHTGLHDPRLRLLANLLKCCRLHHTRLLHLLHLLHLVQLLHLLVLRKLVLKQRHLLLRLSLTRLGLNLLVDLLGLLTELLLFLQLVGFNLVETLLANCIAYVWIHKHLLKQRLIVILLKRVELRLLDRLLSLRLVELSLVLLGGLLVELSHLLLTIDGICSQLGSH